LGSRRFSSQLDISVEVLVLVATFLIGISRASIAALIGVLLVFRDVVAAPAVVLEDDAESVPIAVVMTPSVGLPGVIHSLEVPCRVLRRTVGQGKCSLGMRGE
jgi:hypothetical protein